MSILESTIKLKLEELIKQYEVKDEIKLPPERKLAVSLKASRPTVSKAISQLVAEGTLERKQGSGTFIKNSRMYSGDLCLGIGFRYIYSASDCHFYKIIESMAEYRCGKKISIQIYDGLESNSQREKNRIFDAYDAKLVDGFLLASRMRADTIVRLSQKAPTVIINSTIGSGDITCLDCDYFTAGFLAGELLTGKGHQKIGYIHTDLSHPIVPRILAGMKNALRVANIDMNNDYILEAKQNEKLFRKNIIRYFNNQPVTAVVAGDDRQATNIIRILTEMGKQVPKDVSVIGVGNFETGLKSPVPLTTIDSRLDLMSHIGADILIKKIKGEKIKKNMILIEPKLIERDSVCKQ